MLSAKRSVLHHLHGRPADGALGSGCAQDASAPSAARDEPVLLHDAGLLHAARRDAKPNCHVLHRIIISRQLACEPQRDGEDIHVGLGQAGKLAAPRGFLTNARPQRGIGFDEAGTGREKMVQVSPVAPPRFQFGEHGRGYDRVLARADGATSQEGRSVKHEWASQWGASEGGVLK